MKKFSIALLVSMLFVMLMSSVCQAGYVRGYYRSNGTYVSPYYRSKPDAYKWNNYNYNYKSSYNTYRYTPKKYYWDY